MTLYFNIDRWENLSEDEKEDLKILARLFDADDEEQLIVLYRVLQRNERGKNSPPVAEKQILERANF